MSQAGGCVNHVEGLWLCGLVSRLAAEPAAASACYVEWQDLAVPISQKASSACRPAVSVVLLLWWGVSVSVSVCVACQVDDGCGKAPQGSSSTAGATACSAGAGPLRQPPTGSRQLRCTGDPGRWVCHALCSSPGRALPRRCPQTCAAVMQLPHPLGVDIT